MADMHFTLKEFPKASVSLKSDYSRAVEYTDGEVKIKSISVNGETITPDEDKNVNIPLASSGSGSGSSTGDVEIADPDDLALDDENRPVVFSAEDDGEELTPLSDSGSSSSAAQGNDGLMSKEDKKKLDLIENGAEKNNFKAVNVNGEAYSSGEVDITSFEGSITIDDLKNENFDFSPGIYKIPHYGGLVLSWAPASVQSARRQLKIMPTMNGKNMIAYRTYASGAWQEWQNFDFFEFVKFSDVSNVIGKFTVTPMVSGVTAKFMFDLIYPFDFDGYKIFVNDTETSDGIIKKGSGFVTAPAIFDGDNVKVYFYSGKTAVFYAGVKKLSEIAHAKNGSIKYGVLCT